MAFDGITTAAMVKELNDRILGGRLNKIAEPEADELLLTIKSLTGKTERLLISAHASLPFIYFTEKSIQSPMTAPNFCMLLRKHLQNGRIVKICQPGLERIIKIHLEHRDELGDLKEKVLIIELMGKHSNIIFCQTDDTIIDSIKHISEAVSSVRTVLPGRQYFITKTQDKRDPLLAETEPKVFSELIMKKAQSVHKAIYNSFTGFSPVQASELCFRAGIDGDSPVASLSDTDLQKLFQEFHKLIMLVKDGGFNPQIIYDDGSPLEFAAVELKEYGDKERRHFTQMSEVLETYYAEKNAVTRIRQRSTDLRKLVSTFLERDVRKYEAQLKQLKDTEKKDKYRLWGELIQAYGYGLPPKSGKLRCIDHYTGNEVEIPLDPLLTPQKNAQKYFDRYQKLKRTEKNVSEQLISTKSDISHLESIQAALDIAMDEADLIEIRRELFDSGYVKKRRDGRESGNPKKSHPLHYISSDGYDLYVGKNNYQNDQLTFKFANGDDWWFHSKKFPGSHVILHLGSKRKEPIPDRAFNEAGALAAYYSKGRGQAKVEIDYVEKREVKKPAGAKPGFVVYYTNYSMSIDSDISSLKLVEDA
ncbi:MAG: NFACT family protein [Lachnospiraceae bacterium]|nr:NFACT family protein [Lachnospiraceae bacterium]